MLGGKIICEEEYGGVGTLRNKAILDVGEELEVAVCDGRNIAAACAHYQPQAQYWIWLLDIPWKYSMTFCAVLLPIQCACVPLASVTLSGVMLLS